MEPLLVKRFWVAVGIIVISAALLLFWVHFDTSCPAEAFICIPYSLLMLLCLFFATPVILTIVVVFALRRDFADQNIKPEIKSILKRGMKAFSLIFGAGLAARIIWNWNYRESFGIGGFLWPTLILFFIATMVLSVIYVQASSRKIS